MRREDVIKELAEFGEALNAVNTLLERFVIFAEQRAENKIVFSYVLKHPHQPTEPKEYYGEYFKLVLAALNNGDLHIMARINAAAPLLQIMQNPLWTKPAEYKHYLEQLVSETDKSRPDFELEVKTVSEQIPVLVGQIETLQKNILETVRLLRKFNIIQ